MITSFHTINKLVKTSFLVIYFSIFSFVSTANEKDDYSIRQLKVKDGLSQSSILAMLQDQKGFMWFATGSGLNRFDGYSFKVYLNNPQDSLSISDNGITALYEDKRGNIWIGTSGGFLNRFDRKTDSFKKYNLNKQKSQSKTAEGDYYDYPLLYSRNSDNSITSISEDSEGQIWIGTWGRGVFILNLKNESFVNLCNNSNNSYSLSFNRVTKILLDRDKTIWVATFGGGVNRLLPNDNENRLSKKYLFHHFRHNGSNKFSLSDDKVTTLFEDQKGSLWIGTFYGGLNKIEYELKRQPAETINFRVYKSEGGNSKTLSDNSIMAIAEDDSSFLWIGTFGGGLNRFNPANKSYLYFIHDNLDENTIADNDIISLYKDRSGIIWIGTHLGEGISRLERKSIKFNLMKFNPAHSSGLNDDVVWSILKDKDENLWIGTYRGGLNYYNVKSKSFSYYKNDPGNPYSLSSNHVRSLAEDKFGNIWVGTYSGGLNRLDRSKGYFSRYLTSSSDSLSIGGNQIQKIYIDSNSVMWIAVFGGGLNVLDLRNRSFNNPKFQKYKHEAANPRSLSDDRVYTIYEDKRKNLWVGTFGGGLNRFDKATGNFEVFRNNPNNPFSLQNDKVLCLYEDNSGNFWIGTSGNGLVKFDRDNNKFVSYGPEEKINADVIYGILEDEESNLWLSTSNGIFKFSYLTGMVTHYDLQDGVQSLEFSGGAYFKASDGEMFFGGIGGLNHFYPSSVEDYSFIPPIVISSIKVANQQINGERDTLTLSYDENFVTFEFSALSFSNSSDNSYSYMLDGFDEDWKYTNANYRVANYTNLPPGEYIFKVKGANQDGLWNPDPAKVYLIISPPFWRTWWFLGLSVLLISSTIYYLGSMRSRNELAIEKIKSKLAADLHDNIGSGLTEISILSELVNKDLQTQVHQGVKGKVKNISEISRQLIDSMSDIVWVVNPNRDSLHDLLVRLKDSYSDILSSYGISFKIINLDKLDNFSLPMDYRQNLYLIFKEGINNAIKHSKCKKITLEANVRGNVLELTLNDDGIGLDMDNLNYGNGLKNIETRSKNIGGKMKWKSSADKGTVIRFIGKIKKTKQLSHFLKFW